MPTDLILDGYTITEQHVIDHEFLQLGSPFSTHTPILLVLLVLGIITLAIAAFKRSILLGVLSFLLIASKYLWIPFYLWSKYEDFHLFSYAWRIYPGYWAQQTWIVVALELCALIVIVIAFITNKRTQKLSY